jgi:hypothetical protein
MNAGRELDALVAEKVMGWRRHPTNQWNDRWHDGDRELDADHAIEGEGGDYYHPDKAWEPSTDIAAAWEVVEEMRVLFSRWLRFTQALQADVSRASGALGTVTHDCVWRLVKPEHICRAALAAVGAEPPAALSQADGHAPYVPDPRD